MKNVGPLPHWAWHTCYVVSQSGLVGPSAAYVGSTSWHRFPFPSKKSTSLLHAIPQTAANAPPAATFRVLWKLESPRTPVASIPLITARFTRAGRQHVGVTAATGTWAS